MARTIDPSTLKKTFTLVLTEKEVEDIALLLKKNLNVLNKELEYEVPPFDVGTSILRRRRARLQGLQNKIISTPIDVDDFVTICNHDGCELTIRLSHGFDNPYCEQHWAENCF